MNDCNQMMHKAFLSNPFNSRISLALPFPGFHNGFQALALGPPPQFASVFCRISNQHSWLVNSATVLIERNPQASHYHSKLDNWPERR
jgi:hypothetical protein